MKRSLMAMVLVMVLSTSSALGAWYEVKEGDTLWDISYELNMELEDLISINELLEPDEIWAGQVLIYVSDQDIADALDWCLFQLYTLSDVVEDYQYFMYCGGTGYWYYFRTLYEIALRDIQYSVYDLSGVPYEHVLQYADAWRISQ